MRWVRQAAVLATVMTLCSPAWALGWGRGCGRGCGGCGALVDCSWTSGCADASCAPAAPKMVQKTILVPQMVTETRRVKSIECRPETRTKTIVVNKRVPYQENVTRTCTVMVPQQQVLTLHYTAYRPVMETTTKSCTICVPKAVEKEGVRLECHMKPVTFKKTVCADEGQWEERPVPCGGCCGSPCGDCGHERTAKVWVPKLVKREVDVTVMQPEMVKKPYTYTSYEYHPETREYPVTQCRYVPEPKTRQVQRTICVPQQQTRTCAITRWRCEPQERQVSCTVMVPHEVEREVQVQVCKMVPKQVTVPDCCP